MKSRIICVHGTWVPQLRRIKIWARSFLKPFVGTAPDWFEESSCFRRKLSEELTKRGHLHEFADPFGWSGDNCVNKRYLAAFDLLLKLEREHQWGPTDAKKGNHRARRMGHTEALATALVALEPLPPKHQPHTQMDDIRKLLAAGCQPGTLNLHLAQAKCRLFPDLDRASIYREYGLEDGQA
jgi:hypothetical protein